MILAMLLKVSAVKVILAIAFSSQRAASFIFVNMELNGTV